MADPIAARGFDDRQARIDRSQATEDIQQEALDHSQTGRDEHQESIDELRAEHHLPAARQGVAPPGPGSRPR